MPTFRTLGLAAAVAAAQALPAGFGTFFSTATCPPGWQALPESEGRLVVSVTDASVAGLTVGEPLGPEEDRVHSHEFTTTLTLPSKQVSAIACCDTAVRRAEGGRVEGRG
jgi:hypothetical protein